MHKKCNAFELSRNEFLLLVEKLSSMKQDPIAKTLGTAGVDDTVEGP